MSRDGKAMHGIRGRWLRPDVVVMHIQRGVSGRETKQRLFSRKI